MTTPKRGRTRYGVEDGAGNGRNHRRARLGGGVALAGAIHGMVRQPLAFDLGSLSRDLIRFPDRI